VKTRLRRLAEAAAATYKESPVPCAILAAAVTLGLVYLLDEGTGHLPGLIFLYVIPIWIAARLGDFRAGIGAIAATLVVLGVTDVRTSNDIEWSSLVGSTLLRAGALTLVMFLISTAEWRRQVAEKAAMHDPLTELLNREAVTEFAKFAIERTIRNKEPLTIAMVDCDRFKSANDEFGHIVGDRILQILASRLEAGVRPNGTVARWGGDEFLVVFSGADEIEAEETLAKIQDSFGDATEALVCRLSFTFGVAQFGPGGFNLSQLVQAADADMYRKKRRAAISTERSNTGSRLAS
jgi:diguanylate cyclase (GGDEF)-like protein